MKPCSVSSLHPVVGEGKERTDVRSEGGGVVDAAAELILFDQVTVGLLKTLQTQIAARCSASVAHQSEGGGGPAQPGHPAFPDPPATNFHLTSFGK